MLLNDPIISQNGAEKFPYDLSDTYPLTLRADYNNFCVFESNSWRPGREAPRSLHKIKDFLQATHLQNIWKTRLKEEL